MRVKVSTKVVADQTPVVGVMFKKMTHRREVKILAWVYLAIFSLAMIITLIMETISRDFQGFVENFLMLSAPIALGMFLMRRRAPLIIVLLAAVSVFMPISAAHKFWQTPEITIGMYVLFAPMFVGLIFIGLKGIQSE